MPTEIHDDSNKYTESTYLELFRMFFENRFLAYLSKKKIYDTDEQKKNQIL